MRAKLPIHALIPMLVWLKSFNKRGPNRTESLVPNDVIRHGRIIMENKPKRVHERWSYIEKFEVDRITETHLTEMCQILLQILFYLLMIMGIHVCLNMLMPMSSKCTLFIIGIRILIEFRISTDITAYFTMDFIEINESLAANASYIAIFLIKKIIAVTT